MGVFRMINADNSWDNIETEHECLADLYQDLSDTGAVLCSKLITRRGEHSGERIVVRRIGMIITPRRFVSVEDATIRFVEGPSTEVSHD